MVGIVVVWNYGEKDHHRSRSKRPPGSLNLHIKIVQCPNVFYHTVLSMHMLSLKEIGSTENIC